MDGPAYSRLARKGLPYGDCNRKYPMPRTGHLWAKARDGDAYYTHSRIDPWECEQVFKGMTWGRRCEAGFVRWIAPKPDTVALILPVPSLRWTGSSFGAMFTSPRRSCTVPRGNLVRARLCKHGPSMANQDPSMKTKRHDPPPARDSPSSLCPLWALRRKGYRGHHDTKTLPLKGDNHSHTYRLPLRLAVQPTSVGAACGNQGLLITGFRRWGG